jgi:NADH-quinone oxidoreductase subunit E
MARDASDPAVECRRSKNEQRIDGKKIMEQNRPFVFDDNNERLFQDTLKRYPTKMAALLPTLWLAMGQNGYLTNEVLEYVAERLELSPVHVYAVAEFYTMFHQEPVGRYHLQLCRNLTCTLCGSEDLLAHLADKHQIFPGEISSDGLFSLELVECLGSCGTAPVIRVNDVYCERLTADKLDRIIEQCRAGVDPEEEPMEVH